MATLVLEGDVGIQRIAAVRDQALELVNQGEGIVLDLRRVTDCDASFIQLIYALAASCHRDGLTLTLQGQVAEAVRTKAMAGGFVRDDEDDFLKSLRDLPGGAHHDR